MDAGRREDRSCPLLRSYVPSPFPGRFWEELGSWAEKQSCTGTLRFPHGQRVGHGPVGLGVILSVHVPPATSRVDREVCGVSCGWW